MAVTRKALPTRTAATPTPNAAKVVGGSPETAASAPAGRSSFSSLFDKATASSGGVDIPPGDYEAVLVYARLEAPNDKGEAILFRYSIADEGDHQGKIIPSYYGVVTPDGGEGKGLGYFKRDMAKLGYGDVAGEEVLEALKDAETQQIGVGIKVKIKDGYTNVYLDGVVERSDIIDKWKAEMPELPF